MQVKDVGEFQLIEKFRHQIKTDPSVIVGSGDDCAVLKFDKKNYRLLTCDMLVEGVDFTLKDNPRLVGRKAIAVSLSDIAACSGTPRYCVISLGLPKDAELKYVNALFRGALAIANKYKLNIVGGDLSRSGKIIIDVSMLGLVAKKSLTLRSGALAGDIIFVTGSLGGSIFGKHLKFTPRLKEAGFLAKNYKVNAMIDISDGLVQDLGHILDKSKVGAVIYEELIPLSSKARNLGDALNSGEDFELLFTLSRPEAKRLLSSKLPGFKPIGEILNASYGLRLIDKNRKAVKLTPKGYRHF